MCQNINQGTHNKPWKVHHEPFTALRFARHYRRPWQIWVDQISEIPPSEKIGPKYILTAKMRNNIFHLRNTYKFKSYFTFNFRLFIITYLDIHFLSGTLCEDVLEILERWNFWTTNRIKILDSRYPSVPLLIYNSNLTSLPFISYIIIFRVLKTE